MSRHRHGPRTPRRSRRRVVAETLAASLLVAVVAGVAWYLLAPDVRLTVGSDGDPRLSSSVAVGVFGFDGWFLVAGAVCGLLLGVFMFVRHRHEPVAAAVALVVGGLLGSLVAWQVGLLLGPGPADDRAAGLSEGDTVLLEPGIEAYGVLLAWPIAATIAVLAVGALLDDRMPLTPGDRASPPPLSALDEPGEPDPSDVGPVRPG